MTKLNYSMLESTFYSSNDLERTQMIVSIKKAISQMDNHITQMMNIVEAKVKNYKADFYIHDMQLFHTYKVSFLWIVRESGTNWINLENKIELDNGESGNLSYLKTLMKMPRVKAIYHYDKSKQKLLKVNQEKAILIVSKTYELALS